MPERINNRKLKIAICDDDPIMLAQLRTLTEQTLAGLWELEFACSSSAEQLLEQLDQVSIAVLDIQLPGQNGIELAKAITLRNPECHIIFVTGYIQYVSDVYEVPHFCMVLKDQMSIQLSKYLHRAADSLCTQKAKQLTIKSKGLEQKIDWSLVRFLERRGHITYINLKNGEELQTREKLDDLLKRAFNRNICRCHISYAVNLQWVAHMNDHEFSLHNGEKIPISRANKHAVKESFFRYLKETI